MIDIGLFYLHNLKREEIATEYLLNGFEIYI